MLLCVHETKCRSHISWCFQCDVFIPNTYPIIQRTVSLELTSISTYKMVIWRDDSIPISLGSYLVTGEKRDSSSTLSTFRDWKPEGMREEGTSVNVFEVTGNTVGLRVMRI